MLSTILAWGGFGFQDLLLQLDSIGFFQYVLPFLLIFAFTYAILTNVPVFKDNKGAGAIIAVAIGLLSLQLDFVPAFFQVIWPKFGVGLSVLLVALILSGLFFSAIGDQDSASKKTFRWVFFGLGALIFVVIVASSFSTYTSGIEGFWYQYGTLIIATALIIGGIVAVLIASKKPGPRAGTP